MNKIPKIGDKFIFKNLYTYIYVDSTKMRDIVFNVNIGILHECFKLREFSKNDFEILERGVDINAIKVLYKPEIENE